MKKISLSFLAVALILCVSSAANAGSIVFGGNTGEQVGGTTSGTLTVLFNLDPQDNLQNGGVDMQVVSSDPAFLKLGTAEIINGGRWTIASAVTNGTGSSIQMNTSSVLTPGLSPAGGQNVLFANVPYTLLAPSGSATVSIVLPAEAGIVDGRDFGTDVTPNYTPGSAIVSITAGPIVPEPGTLALVGMSMVGFVLRRRNG